MRYTKHIASKDLEEVNATLASLSHDYSLKMEGRNGYQGLDLYDMAGRCLCTLARGTPRTCIAAANSYASGIATNYIRNLREAGLGV